MGTYVYKILCPHSDEFCQLTYAENPIVATYLYTMHPAYFRT